MLNLQIQGTDWWLPEVSGGGGEMWMGEMGESGQKVQNSHDKVSPGNVISSMVTIVKNTVMYI